MEFVSKDPSARVLSASAVIVMDAFVLAPELCTRMLKRHELCLSTEYIVLQNWLDTLKEIQERVGPMRVRETMRTLFSTIMFQDGYDSAQQMLMTLNDVYKHHHVGDVGQYHVSRPEPETYVVRCETPYPRMFEWGVVDGICQHPKAGGAYDVRYVAGPKDGDLSCTITVRRLPAS